LPPGVLVRRTITRAYRGLKQLLEPPRADQPRE
jgi:hypothetical protein